MPEASKAPALPPGCVDFMALHEAALAADAKAEKAEAKATKTDPARKAD